MHIVIFGSSGMVGQGALREALLAPDVTRVTTVVRKPSGRSDPKLQEVIQTDFTRLEPLACDGCIFAIGVSSAGLDEAAYTKVTYDTALAAAKAVVAPTTTFVFVSGTGAERDVMWARVKRRAENDLRTMAFKAVYVFRPAFIEPLHGIQSRTKLYNVLYRFLWPLKYLFPASRRTTTEQLGQAMLQVIRRGFDTPIIESADIPRAART